MINPADNLIYLKIPYIENLSERVAKELTNENIRIAFKSENTINRCFSKLKSTTPNEIKSGLVYQIPCADCEGVYIGQTGRYLKTRISEHQRSTRPHNLAHNLAASNGKTSLVDHVIKFPHQFDYDKTSVVSTQHNFKKRLLQECITIKKTKNAVNKKQETRF